MYLLSRHPTVKLAPAAMPQRGAGALHWDRAAHASTTKVVMRALEAVKQDTGKTAAAMPDVPPVTLPLQLRPANRLGNLHRLQDLLTDFLRTPPDAG
ncbi:hypothetical protein [Aquabacterium sp.]|uniref:hypothetical protein n=1 Tax=Aquabacterium sp. TaxID=1872578 RepID=UPI0035B0E2A6